MWLRRRKAMQCMNTEGKPFQKLIRTSFVTDALNETKVNWMHIKCLTVILKSCAALNWILNQVYLFIATCTFTLHYQYWWNHSPQIKSIGHLELLNLLSSLTDWTILYTCALKELQMGQPLFWRLIALHAGQNSMHNYKWDHLKWKSDNYMRSGGRRNIEYQMFASKC